MKGRKTRSVTFRVESSIADDLQREAEVKEVSLNVLVNQILKRYSNWDRYGDKISAMRVPKDMLKCLMDTPILLADKNGIKNLDPYRDEMIKRTAQTALDIMKDTIMLMKKEYNLSVLSLLEEYTRMSGINVEYQIEGRKHIFVIKHELGENWSLFMKELLTLTFEKLAKVRVETNITPSTAVLMASL